MEGCPILSCISGEQLISAPAEDFKVVLKGPTGCGKTTLLQKRYMHMVEEMGIPSESILVLVMNGMQLSEWKKACTPQKSGNIWCTTYQGFIQNELKVYYPLVLKNCPEIEDRHIKPVFLNPETSKYLLFKVVDNNRKNKGMFMGITSGTLRIAEFITDNYYKAAVSGISYREIGSRLYNSLELKDEFKYQAYKDMDSILEAYRAKCLKLGIIDNAMAVELYNNCLLKDDTYREQLIKRVRHFIVDNIEECVPVEADLAGLLIPYADSCVIAYNNEGGHREMFGANHEYAAATIMDKCSIIELSGSHTCNNFMYEFSDMLYENILEERNQKYDKEPGIAREQVCELRSEMLQKVGEKVCSLVYGEGCNPRDIVILSTFADPITEYAIGIELEKKGIRVKNISRKNSVTDNRFVRSLITLTILCNPDTGIKAGRQDVMEMIGLLTGMDPVRSCLIADEILSIGNTVRLPEPEALNCRDRLEGTGFSKYGFLKKWIDEYLEEEPLPFHSFFQRAFMELMLDKDISRHDIRQVKRLVDSAKNFTDTVSRFKMNVLRSFIEMVTSGIPIQGDYGIPEEDLENCVVLATPTSFLSGWYKNRVTVLVSLSSENWSPRSIKELSNYHALSRTWNPEDVYTEKLEEIERKQRLAALARAILKRCGEKVITFESTLSANGYENDGILADYLGETLGG